MFSRYRTQAFQSTLPVWGATKNDTRFADRFSYFNPRSPCGERHCRKILDGTVEDISIHAPRVGSDDFFDEEVTVLGHFNPRSPCGERLAGGGGASTGIISIHAPRVGSDTNDAGRSD